MKKVVGISFGRKMKNTEVMVKEALLQCKNAGYEIEFIRAEDLEIKGCTGCIACVMGIQSGRTRGECVHKDDFHIIDNAIMEADAVIYGCPTFETSPTGLFKTVCDRFGPSHDLAIRKRAIEKGRMAGKPEDKLPDLRALKPRIGAFFSVGGAMTQHWLSLMLPTMYEMAFPLGIDIIDTYEYYGAMAFNHVAGNEKVMSRIAKMGQNIAAALAAECDEDRTRWRGDHEGACPICHCNLLTIPENGAASAIQCPVCGIEGELTVMNGIVKANFSSKEQARSRLRYGGKLEHAIEIDTQASPPGQIPDLAERLEKYLW